LTKEQHYPRQLLEQVLECTGASSISNSQPVQNLWSGYGQIVRLQLKIDDAARHEKLSVIVKHSKPPVKAQHPRGWDSDVSVQRKLESYRVEAHWYRHYAKAVREICSLPALLGSFVSEDQSNHQGDNQSWLILEDLDLQFPVRQSRLSMQSCKPCLRWLARFHAHHLQSSCEGLWDTGTYWYLQTRQDEFAAMPSGALKSAAVQLDETLNNVNFQTLVHGDAKVANFCFSPDSNEVAMVDFQYVGRGCGTRDVMYFLSSALNDAECEQYADALLDVYFAELAIYIPAQLRQAVEDEWRDLYVMAWADFHRFLAGWMPGHVKIHDYMRRMSKMALAELSIRQPE